MKPAPKLLAFLIGSSLLSAQFLHAANQTWDGGTNGSATAWFTAANWAGDAGYPGSQSVTTNTDIATFTATGTNTSVGLNMNFTGNTLYLGSIEMTGNRARAFGNSSTTANGSIVLNGATVNSVANTILRNSSTTLMTIQNTQGTGDKTLDLVLGNATNNIIQITSSGGVTISSKITGSGRQLSRQGDGSGTLTLSGNNTFSGGLNYSGLGTLALEHSNAAGAGTINFASTQTGTAATMTLAGGINVANNIIMDAATGRNTINAVTSGSNTLSGNITINNNSSNIIVFQNQVSSSTFTIGGATPNSTTLTAATYSGTISFRAGTSTTGAVGVINSQINAPNAQVNLNNDGVWTIKSTGNTWSLTSMSSANSKFILGADDALATGARVQFASTGGQIDLNGKNQTVAGLVGTGSAAAVRNDSANTDSVLTLAGLTADRSYAGVITNGSGGKKTSLVFNNSNAFTQTLSGTSDFTGTTMISAGTLYVTGALSNSAVTVEANGTIGSNGIAGTLGNGLTILEGGKLDLTGATLDTISTGILSLTGGSLTLGKLTFEDLIGWNWAAADPGTYQLIAGSFSIDWGDTEYLNAGSAYDFGNGKSGYFTSGSLNVVIIPELRAALLGGLGLLILLRRRRH